MSLGGVTTQVQVTAETPVIDPKKTGTSTTVSLEELQNVPSGRDPWVVMQTVPGIIMDRVNVGGSESGQQSGYQAKGASGADATWNLDGVPITDMAATGATPQYWDFDMFQEMNVTTGGADLTAATGGVQLGLVLKSGSQHAAWFVAHLLRRQVDAGATTWIRRWPLRSEARTARATGRTSTRTTASRSAARS